MIELPSLYPHQQTMRDRIRDSLAKHRRAILCAPPGCHARGQGIMLYDGRIRSVEDVEVGDLLMGPDSQPRLVLATGGGRGRMVRIVPKKGRPWIVNEDHIMTIVMSADKSSPGGQVIDVSVREWMNWPRWRKHHSKLFRVAVDFAHQHDRHLLDPYLLGVVLGDGSVRKGSVCVTTADPEIVCHLETVAGQHGLLLRTQSAGGKSRTHYLSRQRSVRPRVSAVGLPETMPGDSFGTLTVIAEEEREKARGVSFRRFDCQCQCGTRVSVRLQNLRSGNTQSCGCLQKNPVASMFHRYGLSECNSSSKFIPHEFKTASRRDRLEVLAGLIDTDGHLSGVCGYDYISKSQRLAMDVAFLARGVGLAAYVRETEKRDQNGRGGTYWRVSISGDCNMIPCRILRKRADVRRQKKDVLRSGFTVEPCADDEYFGFTLAGDGRYLLDDFTVTHNTGKTRLAKWVMGAYANRPKREGESGNAMFSVHRRGLVDNASSSFNESPVLPHGIIMAGCETSSHAIQVASIDTKNSWYCEGGKYFSDWTYDLVVFDETHSHLSKLRTFLDAHDRKREELGLKPAFVLGLSATPQHKELNKVYQQIVTGPSPSWLIEHGYLSPFRYFQCTKGQLDLLVRSGDDYTNDSVSAAMQGLAGDLVRDWQRHAKGRATIGFFPRRSHAQEAMQLLRASGIDAHYVDGETPDEERQEMFRWLNSGDIEYICNVGVIERGTDIPRVGCVQMCTAVGNVVRWRQMIGRGSRVHAAKSDCIVLDHADGIRRHGFFEDDVEWTLEWGERPSKEHAPRANVECPSCKAVYRGGKCRECGYEPTARERKSQGLEFVGGELREVTKRERKEPKKKTCEEMMISGLYTAGLRGGTWGQAWHVAKSMAEKQGTHFRVPATVEVAGRRYKTIPYGHPDAKLRVRDTYGFTVGRWDDADNPYLVQEEAVA